MYGVIFTLIGFGFVFSVFINISLLTINRDLFKRLEIAHDKGLEVCWDKQKYKNAFKRAVCLLKK